MAIELTYYSVILRNQTIEQKYPGGMEAFRINMPGKFCTDGEITSISVMASWFAEDILQILEKQGFAVMQDGKAADIAATDFSEGFQYPCDWATLTRTGGILLCSLKQFSH